jgi:hypothetical protein
MLSRWNVVVENLLLYYGVSSISVIDVGDVGCARNRGRLGVIPSIPYAITASLSMLYILSVALKSSVSIKDKLWHFTDGPLHVQMIDNFACPCWVKPPGAPQESRNRDQIKSRDL